MRRMSVGLSLGVIGVLLAAGWSTARALMIAPEPLPIRIAKSDAVVVGRVVGLEPMDVEVAVTPNSPQKTTYRVAIVQVTESLRGGKEAKMVRVGFIPPPPAVPQNPGGPVRIIRSGRGNVQLEVGQDGLFLLAKHPQEKFYTLPGFGNFIASADKVGFETQMKSVRKVGALLDDPKAGLKSKDADDRLLAASILITNYRPNNIPNPQAQPIDAAESQLILKALADAKWDAPFNFNSALPHPQLLFNKLGVTDKDGYRLPVPVRNQQDISQGMQTWLREHADTYRIQRLVAAAAPK